MPSERVSRERREAVAAAMWQATGGGIFARMHPEGFASRPEYIKEQYRIDANAAIAALLPDRAEFTVMLARLIAAAYEDGMEGRAVPQDASNMVPLIALVYGDDDASGGTR